MRRNLFFCVGFIFALLFCSTFAFTQKKEAVANKSCEQVARGELCGTIEVIVAEKEDGSSDQFVVLKTSERRYRLNGNIESLKQAVDQTVKVSGTVQKNRFEVQSHDFEVPAQRVPKSLPHGVTDIELTDQAATDVQTPEFANIPAQTNGVRNTMGRMIQFTGQNLIHPLNHSQITEAMFGPGNSAKNFFVENSKGVFSIGGGVQDGFATLPVAPTPCEEFMFESWTDQVDAMTNWGDAKTRILLFPTIPGCSYTAIGNVGIKGEKDIPRYVWLQVIGSSVPQAMVILARVVSHETGHVLGFQHASGVTLDGVISDAVDRADYMGGRQRLSNLWSLIAAGWCDRCRLAVISGPQVVTIRLAPLHRRVRRAISLKHGVILQLHDTNGNVIDKIVTFEDRDENIIDSFLEHPRYGDGMGPRLGDANMPAIPSKSFIFDTTPGSMGGFDDAPLAVGLTLDQTVQHGFKVTVLTNNILSMNLLIEMIR